MATTKTEAMSGQEMVDLSRKHTIYEWSAQSKADPIPVARAKGIYFWTPEGKRYLDFNSQLMCVNIGHGDERVIRAIQEQAAVLAYANPFMATEARAQARREARRDRARRHRLFLLHQRRRRGERKRDQSGALVHRPPQDSRALSLVSRRHRGRDFAHRRPAPLGRRARHSRRRPRARSVSRDPARLGHRRRRARRARRGDPARRARTRSPASSSSPSPGPTASSSRPMAISRACVRCATNTAS